ncbi:conjugative transposon protein TraM [Chitinophaga defluvii]|uniref:Conjugative transposon protein TraM n=1 Tax=Chitinophaga defluvii TaxID=3163343 RepID=A0ABV2T5F1_9BACT
MEKTQSLSEEYLRKRRFAVIAPLIIFPFVTVIFSLLGGGKGVAAPMQKGKDAFNYELPAPILQDDSRMGKIDYYEKADRDSARWREIAKRDPYYDKMNGGNAADVHDLDFNSYKKEGSVNNSLKDGVVESPYSDNSEPDKNVIRVQQKLAQLNKELQRKEDIQPLNKESLLPVKDSPSVIPAVPSEVGQLEKMMQVLQDGSQSDPEMAKLDGMLDKILDIQYPSRIQDKMKKQSAEHKQLAYPVNRYSEDIVPVSSLQPALSERNHYPGDSLVIGHQPPNRFYSVDDDITSGEEDNAVSAEIPEYQTLVSGSTVKMRITSDVYIAGRLIPKNSCVYGVASINGERLQVEINSIRIDNSILPISLSAYDLDGMAGIYIPGAIARDVTKNSADQAIQGIPIMSMDPSLGVQAASAGIETAKSLLSKKVRLIKVNIKAGYQVLLKNRQN